MTENEKQYRKINICKEISLNSVFFWEPVTLVTNHNYRKYCCFEVIKITEWINQVFLKPNRGAD